MVQILTDSCVDLTKPLIQRHQLKVIPLLITIGETTYHDGELTLDQFFGLMKETNTLPKTAAPAVVDFVEMFNAQEESIYIGLSSQLSATHQNAMLAAEQVKDKSIRLIDSLNLSTGIALQVLKAADFAAEGMPADQIAEKVLALRGKVRTAFVIETMEYLYKGGRCTQLQMIFGSMLSIRPIIEVRNDGTMGVKHKVRGSRAKALNTMLDDFKADLPNIDTRRVFVTHTGCDADAEVLAKQIKEACPEVEEVLITTAGATIASHCGPDTIGILYIAK